ncbi:MAG: hypothetical protein V5A43_08520 [Haloarculaceae archaeon]
MPIVDVFGTEDRVIPRAASQPFIDAVPSRDTAVVEVPTDHAGRSIGGRAHEDRRPAICDWFEVR